MGYDRVKSEIIHGDCLEVLKTFPDKCVDICITSPPYNLNKKASGGGNSKRSYDGWYFDDMPELAYQEWQKKVVGELIRVTKGSIFYNHRVRYAWHSRNTYRTASNLYHPMQWLGSFPIWCEIVWDRRATSGHANNRCRMSDERIYQIGKPHKFHDMGYTTIWQMMPSKNIDHVCTFPEELVERCLRMCSDEGDTVLDPFSGSGTTAIVAKRLKRDYICIEKDDGYFKKSVEVVGKL